MSAPTFFQNQIERAFDALAVATNHRRLRDSYESTCPCCDDDGSVIESDADAARALTHMARLAGHELRRLKDIEKDARLQAFNHKRERRKLAEALRTEVSVLMVDGVAHDEAMVRDLKRGFAEATRLRNRIAELEAK